MNSDRRGEVKAPGLGIAEPALRAVFAEVFEIEPSAVTDDSSPETVDKWDSFGHMRLVMHVEEHLGVALNMDQVLEIDSYASLCRLLVSGAEDS